MISKQFFKSLYPQFAVLLINFLKLLGFNHSGGNSFIEGPLGLFLVSNRSCPDLVLSVSSGSLAFQILVTATKFMTTYTSSSVFSKKFKGKVHFNLRGTDLYFAGYLSRN